MREEFGNLKKAVEILITRVNAGLSLAQGQGHYNNRSNNLRNKEKMGLTSGLTKAKACLYRPDTPSPTQNVLASKKN